MAQADFTPDTTYARNRAKILAAHKAKYWASRTRLHDACVVCGVPFTDAIRADAKYCSAKCNRQARATQRATNWKAYYQRHGERLRAHQTQRRATTRIPLEPRPCRRCGTLFTPKRWKRTRYCSRLCINQSRLRQPATENARRRQKTAQRREVIPKRSCEWCGRLFKPLRRSTAQWCSIRCMSAKWAQDHPDLVRAHRARRRARLRGVETENIRPLVVFQRDNWTCQLCHQTTPQRLIGTRSPRRPTLDHIVPLAKGGAHAYRNIQCACSRCNSRKQTKIKGQFRLF
jgi:predicted nucleic acid-binding Zn ribbon protein